MGLLGMVRDGAVSSLLTNLRGLLSKNYLAGIGEITDLSYADKRLRLRIRLDGLEDREIEAECAHISIAPDGSSLTLSSFTANLPFMATILNRYLAGKPLPLPEGNARVLAQTAKTVLGI